MPPQHSSRRHKAVISLCCVCCGLLHIYYCISERNIANISGFDVAFSVARPFVHCRRKLNSPVVSSSPLPSHYTAAYVCGSQGTVGGSIWQVTVATLASMAGYWVTQMHSTDSALGQLFEWWTFQPECCEFGFNIEMCWPSVLRDSITKLVPPARRCRILTATRGSRRWHQNMYRGTAARLQWSGRQVLS